MITTTLQWATFETARTDLQPLPIDPTWIKEGAPVARSVTLSKSPDSLLTAGLWDCTAGTFTWIFRRDEIVHILEGEVRVHQGNRTVVLVPGTVTYFPRGLETVWECRPTSRRRSCCERRPRHPLHPCAVSRRQSSRAWESPRGAPPA